MALNAEAQDDAEDDLWAPGSMRLTDMGARFRRVDVNRFGIDGITLTQTGLLFADDLLRLRPGDVVVALAYTRVYPELEALLHRATALDLATILVSDSLGKTLRKRVELVLPVERGQIDRLSMHTATLALFEALLVGVAARRPTDTIRNPKMLNDLRVALAGESMSLPLPNVSAAGIATRPRRAR